MAYARREHKGAAVATTITAGINGTDTAIAIAASTGWPDGSVGPFWVVLARGLSSEEKVLVTSRSGLGLTVASAGDRGEDGTSASAHVSGTTIEHCVSAEELDEANVAVTKTVGVVTTKGDLLVATGSQALARQAAGANDTVLVADSAQTNGIKWAALSASTIPAALLPRWQSSLWVDTIDANVTADQMYNYGTSALPLVQIEAGSLVGISVALSHARTAGSITVEAYKNGVATGLTAVVDDSPTQYGYGTQARGTDTFVAGDYFDLRYTTTSDFATGTPASDLVSAVMWFSA